MVLLASTYSTAHSNYIFGRSSEYPNIFGTKMQVRIFGFPNMPTQIIITSSPPSSPHHLTSPHLFLCVGRKKSRGPPAADDPMVVHSRIVWENFIICTLACTRIYLPRHYFCGNNTINILFLATNQFIDIEIYW